MSRERKHFRERMETASEENKTRALHQDQWKSNESEKRASTQQSFVMYSFLFVVYLARICHGLYMSIPSPTLLFLAQNVDTDVASLSSIFTGRSIGMLFGAVSAGFLLKLGKPMISLGLAVLLSGVFMFFIPFVTSNTMLFLLITLAGLMAGYLDAGLQGLLLKLWGEKDSGPHIQAFHFMFTVGAFLAPLLVRPFLIMASVKNKRETKCPGYIPNATSLSLDGNSTETTTPAVAERINPVAYAFIISATFMVFVAICFFVMAGLNITQRIENQRKKLYRTAVEERPEEPIRDLLFLFFLIILFYFFLIGGEHPYVAYIFSIVVCTELKFPEANASLLTSVLWIGFGAGRLSGTLAARFFKPGIIIMTCLIGGFLSISVQAAVSSHNDVVPWIVAFSYGFFLSMLYPACVSWTSRLTNISGKYMFIFNVGNAIGSMSMTPVGGVIFQQKPFGVIYFSTAFAFGNLLVFLAMIVYGRRRRRKQRKGSENEAYLKNLVQGTHA